MKLFLIGGFLGSGKTTAIQQASLELGEQDLTVGAIMNDQGVQLVDSQFLQNQDIPTKEVTGGCFCCNYDDLDDNIQLLIKENDPDIIFAESVGSCTDLISTIANPLEKYYPDQPVVISIFADARILPVLMQDTSYFFDNHIHYIYKKQLEEADILVVNKIDLIGKSELEEVKQAVKNHYPDKEILFQNSLNRKDIRVWINTLKNCEPEVKRESLDIDYDIYGKGEAKLGWLNGEFEIQSKNGDAVVSAYQLMNNIYETIQNEGLPIGHLKFLLKTAHYQRKVSFNAGKQQKEEPNLETGNLNHASVLINARVQTSPKNIENIIHENIKMIEEAIDGIVKEKDLEAFKPGFPQPTHRILS